MTKAGIRSLLSDSVAMSLKLALAILAVAIACAAQQSQPLLQITWPTAGTVVNPGQTLSVIVTSPANAAFRVIAVIGQGPIGFSGTATTLPAQFSVTIPSEIASGTHMLTAVGATSSGQSASSATILIDVERPDLPTALSAQTSKIALDALGEQLPLALSATFSDGSILEVTESSAVAYSSSDTSVSSVDAHGIVTGIAPGLATITATYTLGGQAVRATILVAVRSLGMAISPASLSFGSQDAGTSSEAQQLSVTNTTLSSLKILSLNTMGDFSEKDDCISSSPLPANTGCTINVTFSPTRLGQRTGAVIISSDFNIVPTSISLIGTGIGQPTTTSLRSSAIPAVFGQTVTFTATVTPNGSGTGTPTGTVTFNDGSTVLATEALSNGQATFSTSSLAAGPHSITGAYSGDSNFIGSSSATLNQSIQYEPVGTSCYGDAGHQILQPIYTNGTSVFKQGQTVPAKFRVCDANGVSIGEAGVVTSFLLTQIVSGTATTNVEEIVKTYNPDTAFRWDPTDQQWMFNISTQNLLADSTYVYTIRLNDGTTVGFQFGLR